MRHLGRACVVDALRRLCELFEANQPPLRERRRTHDDKLEIVVHVRRWTRADNDARGMANIKAYRHLILPPPSPRLDPRSAQVPASPVVQARSQVLAGRLVSASDGLAKLDLRWQPHFRRALTGAGQQLRHLQGLLQQLDLLPLL